ncbi:4-hydroxy-tetrahydrodipicolinate synthase, chloroplastic-like protein, partial [Tanacetum coccineum]
MSRAAGSTRWVSPKAAVIPNFHLPMRSFEVKNSCTRGKNVMYAVNDKASLRIQTSTDEIKSLRLITAIKTPYLPDGRFDLEAYDALVNMQIQDGADGVIVGGTTGE